MNTVPQYYQTPDNVLTEALVTESGARTANLRSQTLRNALFGGAALAGATLLGMAAIVWAQSRDLDPEQLRIALQETLKGMPALKVEPVKIAEGGKVEIAPGGKVALEPGGEVTLAPGAEVTLAKGSKVESPALPDVPKALTTKGGDAIKKQVVVFNTVPLSKDMEITTGWRYERGDSKRPFSQYCYRASRLPNGHTEQVDLAYDRKIIPGVEKTVSNVTALVKSCVWFGG